MIKKIVTTHVVHTRELIQNAIGQHNVSKLRIHTELAS